MLQRLDAASQETLEVFVESPDAGGGSDSKVKSLFQNLKPSNIKQKLSRDRSIDDSTDVSVTEEPFSDNGSEQDGQLDGQIFTVGVAYAQVSASPQADVQTSLTAGMAASHVTACTQVQRLQATGRDVPAGSMPLAPATARVIRSRTTCAGAWPLSGELPVPAPLLSTCRCYRLIAKAAQSPFTTTPTACASLSPFVWQKQTHGGSL